MNAQQLKQARALAYRMNFDDEFSEKAASIAIAGFRKGSNHPAFQAAVGALEAMMHFPALFRSELAADDPAEALAGFGTALASPTVDSDAPAFTTRTFAEFWTREARDQRVFQAFARNVQFEPNRDFFEIGKGGGEVVFRRRRTAEQVYLSDRSQALAKYFFDSYHGGLSWDQFLGATSNARALIDSANQIAAGASYIQAHVTYQTLVTSALLNPIVPLNTTGASPLEDRILTLNDARDQFEANFKNEENVDIAGSNLLLFVNARPTRLSDVGAALSYNPAVVSVPISGDGTIVTGSYTVLPSHMLRNSAGALLDDRYIVMVYPGRENQYADKRELSLVGGTDWTRRIEGQAGELAFGAGCNNSKQQLVVQLWA